MSQRTSSRKRNEVNRSQRKARWIRAKNLMRLYPECNYDNLFYCNHVYDPKYPWVWVDFRFFHTTLKRYFAVAMITAEYEAYNNVEEKAFAEAELAFPIEAIEAWDRRDDIDAWVRKPNTPQQNARQALEKSLIKKYLVEPQMISPSFKIKNYGPVTVGVFATVNKQHIDEHVIREFIAHFQSLGEPTRAGWMWKDKEVSIVPERLNKNV